MHIVFLMSKIKNASKAQTKASPKVKETKTETPTKPFAIRLLNGDVYKTDIFNVKLQEQYNNDHSVYCGIVARFKIAPPTTFGGIDKAITDANMKREIWRELSPSEQQACSRYFAFNTTFNVVTFGKK